MSRIAPLQGWIERNLVDPARRGQRPRREALLEDLTLRQRRVRLTDAEAEALGKQLTDFLVAHLLHFERRDIEPLPVRRGGRIEAGISYGALAPMKLSPETVGDVIRLLSCSYSCEVTPPAAGAAGLWDVALFELAALHWQEHARPSSRRILTAILPSRTTRGTLSALVLEDDDLAEWFLDGDTALVGLLLQRTLAAFIEQAVSYAAGQHNDPVELRRRALDSIAAYLNSMTARLITHKRYELLTMLVPTYLAQHDAPRDLDRAWVELHRPLERLLEVREAPMGDPQREAKRWLFNALRSPVRAQLEIRLEAAMERTSL